MTQFFIRLYDYFEKHKVLFYLSLCVCILLMGYFAWQVRFEENVTRFFPDTKNNKNVTKVFDNLKVKDKIIILLSPNDSTATPEDLIEASDQLRQNLSKEDNRGVIKDIFAEVDETLIEKATNFVYDNLPLFLTEKDYLRFDSLLNRKGIEAAMRKNYTNLLSPAGIALKSYIQRDPLGLGNNALKHLQDFQLETNYKIENGHIFSKDGNTLLIFITPVFGTGSTGENDKLVQILEEELQHIEAVYPTLKASYFGGPSVGVYNARQIKKDTMVTSSIALLIIIVFISLVFKRKKSIPLIITPVLFGGLFALCFIYFIQGYISSIAVGAGSAILGIALSYSIHMLAHQNHVSTVQQLIKEITYPLTVGSFTTIGAFFGLVFTSSELLRDFGLFASLALIGTTLFCLVFLPHFLKGQSDVKQGVILRFIEKINAYPYEKSKWLIGSIGILIVISLFTSQKVRFNEDMMSLNYEPQHLKQAEAQLEKIFNTQEKTVLFVSVGENMPEALQTYAKTNRQLADFKNKGLIKAYASAEQFLISPEEQQKRLERWKQYWEASERRTSVCKYIEDAAHPYHFRKGSFDSFYQWLEQPFQPYNYRDDTKNVSATLLNEWQTTADSLTMLVTQVRISDNNKEVVYQQFKNDMNVVVFDRSYFTNQWVSAINNDFYLILYISSFLIFLALLISYGRIELTLISFLPMLISWTIILGLMGILGIEFNIINIILSTFIFGIGDDFSIFIMDGLQSKYKTGKTILNSHKTAIFFSAFTAVIGMGTLVFAKHPALQSISLISILGMIAVVLVAYTIQPLLFQIFIFTPAFKGLPPYTLIGVLRTISLFTLFLTGCVILRILILLLYLVPIRRIYKQQFICRIINITCKAILSVAIFIRKEHINTTHENFKKPAIIIANHQSFIDILELLSFSPKIIMITNHWVWHSPVFGKIIRYADFFHVDEGYELCVERMREKVKEGYSIAIFPEGTRTYDGKMKRFHKGAFYLSKMLELDIIPVILYGNGKIIAKSQPFNIHKGIIFSKILPRISFNDDSFGTTYQERSKCISAYMKEEYARICKEKNTPANPAFYETLIQNYIYKGPVIEWYIRIKVKMERNYQLFNQLIPMKGRITDIGCGLGPLCYMLSIASKDRQILGVDYDEDKIAIAQNGWLRNENLHFEYADALTYEFSESDVFILSDILHYMSYQCQHDLLVKCAALLNPGGVIIIREGNAADICKHRLTRFTELLSTQIIKFNRIRENLCFTSENQIRSIAEENCMTVDIIQNDKYTSNTIYILKKSNHDE